MKLSIIVAVYNVAETLERCVQSILGQDFGDFELLLVDDGSTDGSGLLADRLAQTDVRLAVFHKANGGLSSARNHGLDRARGEYLAFVDGDDEFAPGTLSAVMALAGEHPEYDMIEYPVTERPGRADCHVFNPGRRDYADALDWLAEKGFQPLLGVQQGVQARAVRRREVPRRAQVRGRDCHRPAAHEEAAHSHHRPRHVPVPLERRRNNGPLALGRTDGGCSRRRSRL